MGGRRGPFLLLLAPVLACVGCHSDIKYVYVDTVAAVSPGGGTKPPPPALNLKVPPATTTDFELAAAPSMAGARSSEEGAAKVNASIKANRDETYRKIVKRLHDTYLREADNLRAQRLAEFEPVQAKLMADAMERISVAYVKYADAMGPKIARLAVTAGFPDPDKEGRRKPSGAEGLDVLAYDTSQTLRAEIAALKSDFRRYSDTTLKAASMEVGAKRTQLLENVEREVGDTDAKVQEVASREVSQAQAQLGPLLADRPPTPLPATPGSRVVVSSGQLPAVSAQPVLSSGPAISDDPEKVRQDLDIWLAVNRYILRGKGHARDATGEFIAWRNRFRQAPSARP